MSILYKTSFTACHTVVHLTNCCLSDCLLPVSVSYNCLTVVYLSSISLTALYLLDRSLPVSLSPSLVSLFPICLPVVYLSHCLPSISPVFSISNLWLYLVTGLPRNEEMLTLYFLCSTTHIFAGACKQRAKYIYFFS